MGCGTLHGAEIAKEVGKGVLEVSAGFCDAEQWHCRVPSSEAWGCFSVAFCFCGQA